MLSALFRIPELTRTSDWLAAPYMAVTVSEFELASYVLHQNERICVAPLGTPARSRSIPVLSLSSNVFKQYYLKFTQKQEVKGEQVSRSRNDHLST